MAENINHERHDINLSVRLLGMSVRLLWKSVLRGKGKEATELFERMNKPEIGDYVMEITAFNTRVIDRIGKLISITDEKYPWDTETIELNGEPPSRDVWKIQTIDGREMRWENCQFISFFAWSDTLVI